MDEQLLKQLEGIEGAADLAAKVREAWAAESSELDSLKAGASKHAQALKALEKARDKALADLDGAKGSTDAQVAAAKKAAEEAVAKLEAEQAKHKAFRIETKLASKLNVDGKDEAEKAAKRAAALKLGDWSGIDLDDSGELVGADAPLKALQEKHSYLFAPPAKGNGGPAGGSGQSGSRGGQKPSDRQSKIEAWQQKLGHAKADK